MSASASKPAAASSAALALHVALGVWLICGALSDIAERMRLFRVPLKTALARLAGLPGAAWGSALAHAGVGVTVLGIVGATAWAAESIKGMRAGDTTEVGPYHVTLVEIGEVAGANYTVDHSAGSYVFDASGKLRLYLRHGDSAANIADDLRRLLRGE